MIQGDKNYLRATLTRGMLELQSRLINLYVGNLQSIGTQAALIGAFSFAGDIDTLYYCYQCVISFDVLPRNR